MTCVSTSRTSRSRTAEAHSPGFDGLDGVSRILIVDDCRLRRDAVSQYLESKVAAVGCAVDTHSLRAEFDRCRPEIILVNMASQGALALLQQVIDLQDPQRIVVFGLAEDDEAIIASCVEAGVGGYHLRSESLLQLANVIADVLRGESACSPRVSAILLRRLSELATQRVVTTGPVLTSREDEVLRMLAAGLSNRDIATHLCITVHTVKNHVHNLLIKLGARSRAEAVALYLNPNGRTQLPARSSDAGPPRELTVSATSAGAQPIRTRWRAETET